MRIAITGITGLVGTALRTTLGSAGHQVIGVSRDRSAPGIHWDPARGEIDRDALDGVEAVIHLAGENLAGGRWTAARKLRIWNSRVQSTRLLAETLARLEPPPRVLVSASAVGFYGDRGDARLDETAGPGDDFLARLCVAWEAAAEPAQAAGIRVVHPRFGLILSAKGGALAKLLPPFRLGLGGRFGTGQQWMSWIAIDDVVRALLHLLDHEPVHGPVNVVTASPVTNAEFARTLSQLLHRPAALPLPAFLLRAVLGKMADATLLASQRAEPGVLQSTGFTFGHPSLTGALSTILAQR